jgi:hypothetical protein
MIDDSRTAGKRKGWVYEGVQYLRIPEGHYSAFCVRWHGPEYVPGFGRYSLRLIFLILSEQVELAMFINWAKSKDQLPGPHSKYFHAWMKVNAGFPRRGEAMSPDLFTDPSLLYTVQVKDAGVDSKGKAKAEYAIYSRVDEILEVTRP